MQSKQKSLTTEKKQMRNCKTRMESKALAVMPRRREGKQPGMDPPSQQRKSLQASTRQEARMPTRRGTTWETEKELQMQQALHRSLERAGGMEKTQQANG